MNEVDHSVRRTYVALRWAVLVVVGMLFVAVAYVGVSTATWQTSISGYYYTAARPVFVATLCAIGACLVLYHARNPENLLLDLAGFLAFVVAFVPTAIDFADPPPGTINVPSADDVAAAVQANVFALLVTGVLAVGVAWYLWREEQGRRVGDKPTHTRWALSVSILGLGIGIVVFVFASSLVENHAHFFAAVTMFLCMFGVVVVNARRVDERQPRGWPWIVRILLVPGGQRTEPFRLYRRVARLMPASAAVLALLGWAGFDHWLFWAEAALILLFAIFWQRQTAEFLAALPAELRSEVSEQHATP